MFHNAPCPHLPEIQVALPITHTRAHRKSCGTAYFQACLELAQSLWQTGSPAQAILQLDKSMMASVDGNFPYEAMIWIIRYSSEHQFLGNPVRHFQHLASRMNHKQPNAEARTWRAWTCMHLTEQLIPYASEKFPRDAQQIESEDLAIPCIEQTLDMVAKLGSNSEKTQILRLLAR